MSTVRGQTRPTPTKASSVAKALGRVRPREQPEHDGPQATADEHRRKESLRSQHPAVEPPGDDTTKGEREQEGSNVQPKIRFSTS